MWYIHFLAKGLNMMKARRDIKREMLPAVRAARDATVWI
jgi:hypothetical protein